MIQLIVRLTARVGRSHELVQALHPLIRRAAQSTGCRGAHLAADVEEADVFWYCEDWDDGKALEARVQTDQFSELLGLMETSVEPPLLEFRVIDDVKGLDYVATVRGGSTAPGHPRRPL
jgi:quinol monooxygenase YgiN